MKHEETINAYQKEYLRMWETIENVMQRKGIETEKKLELQVELDEDWDWNHRRQNESFIMTHVL